MLKFRKKLAEKKEASKGIAKAGFTLIELLVVLAILAILVLLAAPRFLGYTKDANVRAMQADAKVLANAALIYNTENNDNWPTTGDVDIDFEIGDTTVKTKALDETVLRKDHVQTLKGKFTDYALVTEKSEAITTKDGTETLQKGDIIYVGDENGVKDKDDDRHYAVNIELPAE